MLAGKEQAQMCEEATQVLQSRVSELRAAVMSTCFISMVCFLVAVGMLVGMSGDEALLIVIGFSGAGLAALAGGARAWERMAEVRAAGCYVEEVEDELVGIGRGANGCLQYQLAGRTVDVALALRFMDRFRGTRFQSRTIRVEASSGDRVRLRLMHLGKSELPILLGISYLSSGRAKRLRRPVSFAEIFRSQEDINRRAGVMALLIAALGIFLVLISEGSRWWIFAPTSALILFLVAGVVAWSRWKFGRRVMRVVVNGAIDEVVHANVRVGKHHILVKWWRIGGRMYPADDSAAFPPGTPVRYECLEAESGHARFVSITADVARVRCTPW